MKKRLEFYAGLLAGLGAPLGAFQTKAYPRLGGSDLARLRGDVGRIGGDFSKVIARENGKTNPKSK